MRRGGAKVRKRVDSDDGDYTSKGQDVAKDQIMDSANHTHGHKESPNVVYYKVRIKKTQVPHVTGKLKIV